ncbi:anhydro-N-acetylmuramic acid kinase [Myroides sp. LJL116]
MGRYCYSIVGVMSGTSLDGIDLAYVKFSYDSDKEKGWSFSLKEAQTIPYKQKWRTTLKQALHYSKEELEQLNHDYTVYLAGVIQDFITQHNLEDIDAVCSHGHTILHQPDLGYTLQIGNLPILADLINQTVVCDFRTQDVALKGQGAPLVPLGDALLFSQYQACVNLGGFANISFTDAYNKRIAFDICPVNIVLNAFVAGQGLLYDKDGDLSKLGKVNVDLLEELNALDYYKEPGPKSLGVEFVQEYIQPVLQKYTLSTSDYLCTYTAHIVKQIKLVLEHNALQNVLLSGGGSHNAFLVEQLKSSSDKFTLVVPTKDIVDFKEAIIFGFLGVLRLLGQNNILSSVTGATKDHCGGMVYQPFTQFK